MINVKVQNSNCLIVTIFKR